LKFQKRFAQSILAGLFAVACIHFTAKADEDDALAGTNVWTSQNSRFGPFGVLDHRSAYYQDGFPEPILIEQTEPEPEGEVELSYLHTEANGQQSDAIVADVEQSFGPLTFELDVPYIRQSDDDDVSEGVGTLDPGVRCPFYQFVSADGFFDTTLGVDVEAAIPVDTSLSKNGQLEPAVFDDLRLGNHITLQPFLGYSIVLGGGDNGGEQELEYGMAVAYTFRRTELRIPGVQAISPMFELNGELGLNEDESGQNDVLGSAGVRVDFQSLCGLEPSVGVAYVFPMDAVAREETKWGIAASFTVEF
jgi:hypothetical protein